MKLTILLAATSLLALTSATRLCDKLLSVRSNIATLSQTLSSNVSDSIPLFIAYRNLNAATTTLKSLESDIKSTTSAINGASSTLANLDIQTGCWIGWLTNLETGLEQTSMYLQQITQKGAQDLMNGDVKSVKGYGKQIADVAGQAAGKLDLANQALATLDRFNNNVICW
jgi:hypothetical protein